jgi:hypothetical protein
MLTTARIEVAAAGNHVPHKAVAGHNWRVVQAIGVTRTIDSYRAYIHYSLGEFGVCRPVFRATHSG